MIPGRYIVAFGSSVRHPGALSDRLSAEHGFMLSLRYRHALLGFAASLNAGQVTALSQHPQVEFVVPDREVHALGTVGIIPPDVAPTGIRRIESATTTEAHEASSVNAAVIDTGIDLLNADLNSENGKDCTGSEPAQDDNGHGTHVAGTIGAENDGSGVVGMAPGTEVWAVKVLNSGGSGSTSQIVCGIDWVTGTRSDADPGNDIAVANMSLGGFGPSLRTCATTTDPMHRAICNSTAAGVMYVVAAGNENRAFDASTFPAVPAVYPEVLTVTAASDSDGLPGALGGPPTCRAGELDESTASFSNFARTSTGASHTVAGPGVCIESTWPGGGTMTISGTSMASPHLAGVVALCLDEAGVPGDCDGLAPAQIIQEIRSDAETYNTAEPDYGFTGDPSPAVSTRYYGYLAHVGMAPPGPPPPPPPPDTTPPSITSVAPPDLSTGVSTETNVSVAFDEAMDETSAEDAFSLVPTLGGLPVDGSFTWSGNTMTFDPTGSLADDTSYTAEQTTAAMDAAGNALSAGETWTFETLTNVSATPDGATIQTGSLRNGTFARLAVDDNSYYLVDSTTGGTRVSSWYGSFQGVSNDLEDLQVTYKGGNSKGCVQTISIWKWTGGGSWTQLDSRIVGGTEVLIVKTPTGALGDYVSGAAGAGELRVRVRCVRTASAFVSAGDLMKIAYTLP